MRCQYYGLQGTQCHQSDSSDDSESDQPGLVDSAEGSPTEDESESDSESDSESSTGTETASGDDEGYTGVAGLR